MTTHVGKIGRLSKDCREELGRRIEDGHSGRELVDWLNGLTEVQAMLREKFGGRDINETNLSAWRQSGHLNWLRRQEAREGLRELVEDSNRLDDAAGDWMMGERLGAVVAAEMNGLAMALLSQEPDLTKRWKYFCEIHREVSRLRQDDDRYQRMVLQKERWDQELAKRGIALEPVKRCVAPPTPGFGATRPPALDSGAASPAAPDSGAATEGKGCEDDGEVAETVANLENSRQIKEDQGEDEVQGPKSEAQSPGTGDGEGRGIKNEELRRKNGEPQGSGNTGLEAEVPPAVPVNSQTGKSALHKEARPEFSGGDAGGTISLPRVPRVPDPDPETEAYIRWWQMHRGFEPFDYEELQRLYAAIPKENEEAGSQESEAGINGEEVNAEAQRGEGAGEMELTTENAKSTEILCVGQTQQ
jgi:hypothetical protein